jgi:hypothetical protein
MAAFEHLVEDWRAMKAKLEQQLAHLENAEIDAQHHTVKQTLQRWIVELDDLIIKYSFEI